MIHTLFHYIVQITNWSIFYCIYALSYMGVKIKKMCGLDLSTKNSSTKTYNNNEIFIHACYVHPTTTRKYSIDLNSPEWKLLVMNEPNKHIFTKQMIFEYFTNKRNNNHEFEELVLDNRYTIEILDKDVNVYVLEYNHFIEMFGNTDFVVRG